MDIRFVSGSQNDKGWEKWRTQYILLLTIQKKYIILIYTGFMIMILFLYFQIIPDFQVNGEDYPGIYYQIFPAIAGYDSGGVVIWYDLRLPNYGTRVYGTLLYSSGDTIGNNFPLNEDSTTGCFNPPAIDCDSAGNFTIVYIQYQNVLARRFNRYGNPNGPSFIVNQTSGCSNPAIAVSPYGRIVIVWLQNYGFYGQIYDPNGNPVGTNFLISDSTITLGIVASIAMDNNSNFIVTWPFAGDIWAQKFDSSGNRIGENFRIINDTMNINESDPQVKYDNLDNLLVTWTAGILGQSDINCQIFDSTLTPITEVIRLDAPDLDSARRSRIAVKDSIFYVVFQNGTSSICLQLIKNNGELIGNNICVSEPEGRLHTLPKIGVVGNSILITWHRRFFQSMSDIVCQRVSFNGSLIGNNYVISDDKGGASQILPGVAADNTGNFFIVWDDYRMYPNVDYNGNQYGRRYGQDGSPLCDEFRVNTYVDGVNSSIGLNSNMYVTVWARTNPDSSHQVYAQRFDYNGNPIGANYQISMSNGDNSISFPRTTNLSNEHFLVVWTEENGARQIIYGRFLDQNGIPYGNQFSAYVDSLAYNSGWTAIDEGNNRFIVPISCNIESLASAIQEFDYAGNPVSAPIVLNDEPAPNNYVCGAKGIVQYLFVWPGAENRKIIGQFVDDSLQKIGANFVISDDTIAYKDFCSVVSNVDGKFFVLWDDQRNGNPDLYGQFFDSLGNKIDNNFRVDNDTTNSEQSYVSCFSANNRIYIVWSDTRILAHWYDVYCKVIEWPEYPFVQECTNVHNQISLYVYPNPFRNHCVIKFQIPNKDVISNQYSVVSIKIYDITGRSVKSFLLPTDYCVLPTQIVWSGCDDFGRRLPAGVYFIRLETEDYKKTEKSILLR